LLGVSGRLAAENHERYQEFQGGEAGRPCVFTYDGPAFQGIDAATVTQEALEYMQDNLRILSGLYGALRPLDRIEAYRLEMITQGVLPGAPKMNEFWREDVTKSVASTLEERPEDARVLVNLASDAYAKSVDTAALPEGTRVIKCVFHDEGRVVTVFAKRARGLMVRHLCVVGASSVDDICSFDAEGYQLKDVSADGNTIVFDRPASRRPPPARPRKAEAKTGVKSEAKTGGKSEAKAKKTGAGSKPKRAAASSRKRTTRSRQATAEETATGAEDEAQEKKPKRRRSNRKSS